MVLELEFDSDAIGTLGSTKPHGGGMWRYYIGT